jgi:hypothetical protein
MNGSGHMKYYRMLNAPVLVLVVLLISAGCTNPAAVNQVPSVSNPETADVTPAITRQVTEPVTVTTAGAIPEETPIPVQAYVKRPFGFVQYTYDPAHKVRLLETHVETDPTGARMIVGTIKNIGPDRLDFVTVTINLLDADGYTIGSSSSEVNYLEPDKIWKFRTSPFTMSDFKSYTVADIFTG